MALGKWSEVEARGVLDGWRKSGVPLERFAKSGASSASVFASGASSSLRPTTAPS